MILSFASCKFLMWEWDLILPGWRWFYKPRVGVSKPCGAVSTRGITVFVPGSSGLQICGIISDSGMITYLPLVALALQTPGWGVHIERGGIDPGDHFFVPGLLELYMYGRVSNLGMRPYPPQVVLALRTPGWRLQTVRSGIDPGCHRFRPRYVGVEDAWKDL